MRRHWFKALEVLRTVVVTSYRTMQSRQIREQINLIQGSLPQTDPTSEEENHLDLSKKQAEAFGYEFVINFLSKASLKEQMLYL